MKILPREISPPCHKKKLVGLSVRFIVGASALCVVVSVLATVPLVGIFTRTDRHAVGGGVEQDPSTKDRLFKMKQISFLPKHLGAMAGAVFTRTDSPVYELAVTGNRLCSIALLFVGLNVLVIRS